MLINYMLYIFLEHSSTMNTFFAYSHKHGVTEQSEVEKMFLTNRKGPPHPQSGKVHRVRILAHSTQEMPDAVWPGTSKRKDIFSLRYNMNLCLHFFNNSFLFI